MSPPSYFLVKTCCFKVESSRKFSSDCIKEGCGEGSRMGEVSMEALGMKKLPNLRALLGPLSPPLFIVLPTLVVRLPGFNDSTTCLLHDLFSPQFLYP